MTSVPLEQLRLFSWRSHQLALWWLGLLYRRPWQVQEALEALPRKPALLAGSLLYLHCLPYAWLISLTARLALYGLSGIEIDLFSVVFVTTKFFL